ncbi:hypothetical protein [Stieleria varia]|uniref:Uncharacterized protein n=1 Tax=Stieleria varia TaxID=2528005 RepID=A0A5C6APT3_9BACT|nr:hypothetical protein [Stieleria varia]TWU01086.1 hypothetical protein Pla52n_44570 [Stieleria varia]
MTEPDRDTVADTPASIATDGVQIPDDEDTQTVVSRGLTNADFQRLGVDPREVRHMVIRRAALETTEPLAQRYLQAPSAKLEIQLTQIATSTYRVLDPRQRTDPSQRANVGRIRPNLIDWAGRTEFALAERGEELAESNREHLNDGGAASRSSDTPAASSKHSHTIDFGFLKSRPLESPDTVLDDGFDLTGNSQWPSQHVSISTGIDLGLSSSLSRSLDSGDLVRDDFRRSPIRRFRFWLRQPATLLGLIAILVATSGGVLGWSLRRSSVVMVPTVQSDEPIDIALVEYPDAQSGREKIKNAAATPPAQVTSPKPSKLVSRPVPGSPVKSGSQMGSTESTAASGDASTEPTSSLQIDPIVLAARARSQTISLAQGLGHWFASASNQVALQWNESLTSLAKELQSKASEMPSAVASIAPPLDPAASDLPEPNPQDVPPYEELAKAARDYIAQPVTVATPVEHFQKATAGLRLHDQLICIEQFVLAQQLADQVRRHCAFSNDLDLVERIKADAAVASEMREMSNKVDDILQRSVTDEPSSGDAAIVGRYLCLYQRNWQRGGSWIENASDVRLASLAKQDVELTQQLAAQQLKRSEIADLASKWFKISARFSGREAESIALRALHWYQLALADDTENDRANELGEVQTLRTRAEMQSLIESLPVHLQPITPSEVTTPKTDSPSAQPVVANGPRLMHGTIRPIDVGSPLGEIFRPGDLVLGFQYSPGITISPAQWTQIGERLFVDDRSIQLELAGEFSLSESTTIEIVFSAGGSLQSQSILIDSQQVDLTPGKDADEALAVMAGPVIKNQQSTSLSLDPGKHTVRWNVVASQIDTIVLALVDADSKSTVHVTPDPSVDLSSTRGMVSLLPSR